MPGHLYTVEQLMLDESFINYCLSKGSTIPSRWKNIIRENPAQERTFEEAKRLVLALHGGLSRPEVNRQIEIVRGQLEAKNNKKAGPVKEDEPPLSTAFVITNKGQIKRRLLKTAVYSSAVICIMIAGLVWWFVFRPVATSPGLASFPEQVQSYHSPRDQRQKVELPDGSLVILNSNSSISMAFTNEKREIRLKGDAFFQVAKDVTKPFVVTAENIATTALGTEFYIHSRNNGEGNIQVDLLEGKVQVVDISNSTTVREIILNPGESGKYREGSTLQKTVYDSHYLRSWISGRITFKQTPVLKALQQLESWYGIRIEVLKSNLDNRLINGDYTDEPLQNILEIICFSTNSRYVFKENKVVIE